MYVKTKPAPFDLTNSCNFKHHITNNTLAMKKVIIPIALLLISLSTFAQQAANFTIITNNNGIVTKYQKKYLEQAKALFPQVNQWAFVKNDHAAYTLKITIDSPQVVDVINTPVTTPTTLYSNDKVNEGNPILNPSATEEKHQYNITYIQSVIRVQLIDDKGNIIAEKKAAESPVFKAMYTRSFRITEPVSKTEIGPVSPEQYYTLFIKNTPPSDFAYKTDITEALNSLAKL